MNATAAAAAKITPRHQLHHHHHRHHNRKQQTAHNNRFANTTTHYNTNFGTIYSFYIYIHILYIYISTIHRRYTSMHVRAHLPGVWRDWDAITSRQMELSDVGRFEFGFGKFSKLDSRDREPKFERRATASNRTVRRRAVNWGRVDCSRDDNTNTRLRVMYVYKNAITPTRESSRQKVDLLDAVDEMTGHFRSWELKGRVQNSRVHLPMWFDAPLPITVRVQSLEYKYCILCESVSL